MARPAFFLPASSAVIANGQAAVSAVANNMDGSYQVAAVTAASGSSPATFNLTNTGPVFTHLIVNTTSDSLFPGVGLLSLREAITFANVDNEAPNITFDSKVFGLPQTITLTGTQLELTDTIGTETIVGPKKGVTVSGGGLSRVFQVDGGVTAEFSGLIITGGTTASTGGGLNVDGGTATLTDCTISGNSSGVGSSYGGYGGGLSNKGGNVTLTDCTISGNAVEDGSGGGGVATLKGGNTTLNDCTISSNLAVASRFAAGGGLIGFGRHTLTTLTGCTISGNSTVGGGGGAPLFRSGNTAVLTDCTVSGNSVPAEAWNCSSARPR